MAKREEMDIEQARGLVSNPVLWPRARDFLWDFAPQVHPSWLDDLPGHERFVADDGAPHASCLMSNPKVKAFVLSSLGVEPCFHLFPKEDGSRLLLLDAATLESVAKWLGALACADMLRKVMDGATVRELKAALPGIYPEVFGYTAYFKGMNSAAKNAKSADDVVATGFALLFSAFAALPSSLVSRLRFKFPQNLCDLCVISGKKEDVPSRLQVVNKLLKLKFPEAFSLCCS
jgi:hypothetical protein